MQNINAAIQTICGISSIPYNGALGHCYIVNSLLQIIAQVMVLLCIHDYESHVDDRKWQILKSDHIFIFIQRIVTSQPSGVHHSSTPVHATVNKLASTSGIFLVFCTPPCSRTKPQSFMLYMVLPMKSHMSSSSHLVLLWSALQEWDVGQKKMMIGMQATTIL
jgi:hypothetical protein